MTRVVIVCKKYLQNVNYILKLFQMKLLVP